MDIFIELSVCARERRCPPLVQVLQCLAQHTTFLLHPPFPALHLRWNLRKWTEATARKTTNKNIATILTSQIFISTRVNCLRFSQLSLEPSHAYRSAQRPWLLSS